MRGQYYVSEGNQRPLMEGWVRLYILQNLGRHAPTLRSATVNGDNRQIRLCLKIYTFDLSLNLLYITTMFQLLTFENNYWDYDERNNVNLDF